MADAPTILATSMGLNRARDPWQPGPIFRYACDLAGSPAHPKLCLLATGTGDRQSTIDAFVNAFAGTGVHVSALTLFPQPNVSDVAAHLREQDVIWVDRGSVVNLLAVWRAHNLPSILDECWQSGIVLAGESAGSLCWHRIATTDSFGELRGIHDGLGFLPYANAVHYEHEAQQQKFHQLISSTQPESPAIGYATDTGAGLHYENDELVAAISDRPKAAAYRILRDADNEVREEPLNVHRLKRAKGA